nr:uncharacterized protein LOC105471468 [Macaca nemestrina]
MGTIKAPGDAAPGSLQQAPPGCPDRHVPGYSGHSGYHTWCGAQWPVRPHPGVGHLWLFLFCSRAVATWPQGSSTGHRAEPATSPGRCAQARECHGSKREGLAATRKGRRGCQEEETGGLLRGDETESTVSCRGREAGEEEGGGGRRRREEGGGQRRELDSGGRELRAGQAWGAGPWCCCDLQGERQPVLPSSGVQGRHRGSERPWSRQGQAGVAEALAATVPPAWDHSGENPRLQGHGEVLLGPNGTAGRAQPGASPPSQEGPSLAWGKQRKPRQSVATSIQARWGQGPWETEARAVRTQLLCPPLCWPSPDRPSPPGGPTAGPHRCCPPPGLLGRPKVHPRLAPQLGKPE